MKLARWAATPLPRQPQPEPRGWGGGGVIHLGRLLGLRRVSAFLLGEPGQGSHGIWLKPKGPGPPWGQS